MGLILTVIPQGGRFKKKKDSSLHHIKFHQNRLHQAVKAGKKYIILVGIDYLKVFILSLN